VYGYGQDGGYYNASHTNSFARSNLNNGACSTKSNADYAKRYYKEKKVKEPPDSVESVGHIQFYCPVLQLPRIAIHHGIWSDLMFSIRKSSLELNYASEPRWHFPSALSPEAHAEWGLYKILFNLNCFYYWKQ